MAFNEEKNKGGTHIDDIPSCLYSDVKYGEKSVKILNIEMENV